MHLSLLWLLVLMAMLAPLARDTGRWMECLHVAYAPPDLACNVSVKTDAYRCLFRV